MLSAVSLPNHTFNGQAESSKRLTSIVHILSPETDNWRVKGKVVIKKTMFCNKRERKKVIIALGLKNRL